MRRWIRVAGAIVLAFLIGGCGSSSVSFDEDLQDYEDRVDQLQTRISNNPNDAKAHRDLGAIYVRTGNPSRAYDALKEAYARIPGDPKTLFYLGVAAENVGKRESALDLYREFGSVPQESKYRTLMRGRYEGLVRQQARSEIRTLMQREQELAGRDLSPRAVAVLPLRYQGGDDRYEPLGRGLAEMLLTDLAKVERLQVVERIRLQALLDELKLAESEYVDPSTAPRVGRLIGAGQLVGGSYIVTDDEQIRMNVTLADVASGVDFPEVDAPSGTIDQLFDLQTQLVFRLVDRFGIELTAQERASIESVPTRSLQAFLAYSQGLLDEDDGNYGAAAQHFQRAREIDPNFEAAAQRRAETQSLSAAGGSPEEAVASAQNQGGGVGGGSSIDLMGNRLSSMPGGTPTGLGGGSSGDDGRDPAAQSSSSEAEPLDPPPAPPSSGGSQGGS